MAMERIQPDRRGNLRTPHTVINPSRRIRARKMSAGHIEELINSLGKSLNYLMGADAVFAKTKKIKIFPEDEYFHMNTITGVELKFYEKTQSLEAVSVTLEPKSSSRNIYVGGLPEPYKLSMNFQWVRQIFGPPYKSHGPKPMPKPLPNSGGWDNYLPLDKENIEIYITYSEYHGSIRLNLQIDRYGS